MTDLAQRAITLLAQRYPGLPPDAASVLLLCAVGELTVPGIARRLELAQSTVLRLLALLHSSGLVDVKESERAKRYELSFQGKKLVTEIAQ